MEDVQNFLGRGWCFPVSFTDGGADVHMVMGEEDIRQSLGILLSTALGERTMFSTYGCDLNSHLFEEVDQSLITRLSSTVTNSILLYEPRIDADEISVDQSKIDTGLLLITIDYTVRSTNNRYNMVYPFYINEANQPV